MSAEAQARLAGLFERLKNIEVRLERELRRRGFDPAQVDRTALPAALATLVAERDAIRDELEDIQSEIGSKQHGAKPTRSH